MKQRLVAGLTLDNRHDGPLLDSRGALETISIDTFTASQFSVAAQISVGDIATYLEAALTSGSSHRKSRRFHRSWTRFDLMEG